jgi:hypothetical protein
MMFCFVFFFFWFGVSMHGCMKYWNDRRSMFVSVDMSCLRLDSLVLFVLVYYGRLFQWSWYR